MSAPARSAATLAARIAGWGSALAFEAIPAEVVRVAKRCMIDLVGVTIAAAGHPASRRVLDYAGRTYAPGAATVLAARTGLSPVGAALVNGTAGHALDFDDTSYTGIMHGTTVALPAALAATEAARGDGRRLVEAFIVGSEVTYAVALLCTTEHYFKGWWSTGTFGAFGAAAAAARALGLPASKTTAALALAGAQACGLKAVFGTDAKPYVAGRAAAIGVEAALLAEAGLTGPEAVLEDARGFLALLNDGRAELGAVDDLGQRWRLIEPGIYFKRYPVCSGAQAATELTRRLLDEHGIAGDSVRRVICEVPPLVGISLVYDRPRTPSEAQFSLPFAVGAVLARGDLGLDALSERSLADRRLAAAMARVEMRQDPSLADEAAPECARVTVETDAGRQVSGFLAQPTGMPGNPMSDQALADKFHACMAAGGLAGTDAEALLAHLNGIEAATSPLGRFAAAASPS